MKNRLTDARLSHMGRACRPERNRRTAPTIIAALFAAGVAACSPAASGSKPHWTYQNAPEWATADTSYFMCAAGAHQSPIDLSPAIESELPELVLRYRPSPAATIIDTGHSLQFDYEPGNTLVIDGSVFELKQFHFHAPSEHQVGGEAFPLEAHLVHANQEGALAVIGVFFKVGTESAAIESILSSFDPRSRLPRPSRTIDAASLLPSRRDYVRYSGSLTTPPCTEGVRWIVLDTPLELSSSQLERLQAVSHSPNNRPLQPRNARVVLK